MSSPPIVSRTEWIEARKELLAREKQASKQREELTALRQQLPWYRLETDYEFDAADGRRSLSDLFGNHSQLLVYHFMFGPDWTEGCPACSMLADHYDPLVRHLQARDVALATVSRAPIEKLIEYRTRMGWGFEWVSSLHNRFNQDFHVSFTQQEQDAGTMKYNYATGTFPSLECPGISVFIRNSSGDIFHTYSAYARGLENLLGVYSFLDIVPKGRDEDELPFTMAWVRRHDSYDAEPPANWLVELGT